MIDEQKVIFTLRDGATSPTFIASADVHLGKKLYNIPELEDDMKDNFVRLCDLAVERKVEYLVICGDLFDTNLPTANTVAFVRKQVERLFKVGTRVVGIAGDHDKPIDGESWCSVSGLYPISICPQFGGFDYYNTSSGMAMVMKTLLENCNPAVVQWLFLHCQFPAFFQFTDEKKKIDFNEVNLFQAFPNLQGVIAGDVHAFVEGDLVEGDKKGYIGYTGSLGITDMAEAQTPRCVIHCDGQALRRVIIPNRRVYIRLDFRGDGVKDISPALLADLHKNDAVRPVFSVDYDSDSEGQLQKIKPLYTVGHVRTHQVLKSKQTGLDEEVTNVRSEMKTADKIEAALKECCEGNKPVYSLLSDMLSSTTPRSVLDDFKDAAGL